MIYLKFFQRIKNLKYSFNPIFYVSFIWNFTKDLWENMQMCKVTYAFRCRRLNLITFKNNNLRLYSFKLINGDAETGNLKLKFN